MSKKKEQAQPAKDEAKLMIEESISEIKKTDSLSYFAERMQLLGVTPEINEIKIKGVNDIEIKEQVFRETKKGIEILLYTIERRKIFYKQSGADEVVLNERGFNVNEKSKWSKEYTVTRLEIPFVKKDGSVMKYEMPKGQSTLPFFPPQLVAKFDSKTEIEVLYLTEGYFKAFKAAMHGIDCIGVPSITCLKDKESGELFPDIQKIITTCRVKRIVWLVDGDCRNITTKEIKDGIDLYRRPNGFYVSVATFYDLTSKLENVQKYFAHINSDNFETKPKGLDDLLIELPEEKTAIAKEFNCFDKRKGDGKFEGNFVTRFDISQGVGKVLRYFFLHDVDLFYLHHVEQRPDLKNKEFKFHGTLYMYDDKEAKCIIKIPKSAANYFRCGNDYFEYVEIPDKYGTLTRRYDKRVKDIIVMDNGKDIFKHIPKYKAFCNVPDHVNYQRVIHNCFNTYHPFSHEPEDGNCSQTIDFIKHIFGTEKILMEDGGEIERYELALDYLTILYKMPQQILPILCLVSKERQTGKTTFLKWLKLIFTENLAIVSNQDFENNFNSHWATKLIIGCDETKIEKHVVMERIKGLSTAGSIMKEAKGTDQVAMDFFGKFILLSNNEDNFASIDKEEIRFWVIKVPVIKGRNVDLLTDLLEEIPAFLHFLSQRKIITLNKERHWFDTKLLRTDALDRIVDNSKPTVQKLLRIALGDLFSATIHTKITIPLDAIVSELLKNKYDKTYVKQTLHEMNFKTQDVARLSYPRFTEKKDEKGNASIEIISVSFHNRYYEFVRTDFVTDPGFEPGFNKMDSDFSF